MTGFEPAPKLLAQLAEQMRGWPYEETRASLIAASQAGWDTERIYREMFRLLLREDAGPADLRQASRNPLRPVPAAGDGTLERGLAAAREALEHRQAAAALPGDPEGDEAA